MVESEPTPGGFRPCPTPVEELRVGGALDLLEVRLPHHGSILAAVALAPGWVGSVGSGQAGAWSKSALSCFSFFVVF